MYIFCEIYSINSSVYMVNILLKLLQSCWIYAAIEQGEKSNYCVVSAQFPFGSHEEKSSPLISWLYNDLWLYDYITDTPQF